jgi:UDP-N-acetylmuramyl pentapeptide synthase
LDSDAHFLVFTGTSGKTLARSTTTYALRKTGHVVISPPYGYTNELGIVLAALGIEAIKLFSFSGLRRVLFEKPKKGVYICIELGADWYPDTKWFLKHFKPFGVCLTNITKEEWVRPLSVIWNEKNLLIKSIPSHGFVCYSSQNDSLKKIKVSHSFTSSLFYEFSVSFKDTDHFVYFVENSDILLNSSFAGLLPYREAFGTALTCLCALGVSISSDDFFSEYKPVTDRLLITQLTSGAVLVADTYKAIPQCTEYILRLASSIQKEKKVLILSEMRPIWKNKEIHYKQLVPLLKHFTQVYFIGPPDVTKILSHQLQNLQIIENENQYKDIVEKITTKSDAETLYVVKGAGYYHFSNLVSILLSR